MTAPDLLSHAHEAVRLAAESEARPISPAFQALLAHAGTHYGAIAAACIEAVGENARLRKELETEQMRLTACSVAALGHFTGDCHPDYRSVALDDVLALRAALSEARTEADKARGEAYRVAFDAITGSRSVGEAKVALRVLLPEDDAPSPASVPCPACSGAGETWGDRTSHMCAAPGTTREGGPQWHGLDPSTGPDHRHYDPPQPAEGVKPAPPDNAADDDGA